MSDSSPPTLDSRAFRNAMGLFATGVTVIATHVPSDTQVHAMTANSVTSLSLDPMLLLFCPAKQSSLAQYLPNMRSFSVNVLRDTQRELSSYFAGNAHKGIAPEFEFLEGKTAPYLVGALVSVECLLQQVIDGGDHWLVIGRALSVIQTSEPHNPLLFFKGSYRSLGNS
jgi:3-hydroxy-9,10-secoandrosta-1,3,5(10)-triene-9,17-dione monooxygenase reductase component